jgi:hypothetical protein
MAKSFASGTVMRLRPLAALAALSIALSAPLAIAQEAPPSTPAGDANLFVFRAYAEPTLWPTTVKIDGRAVASLSERSFTAVRLDTGSHKLKLSWPLLAAQQSAETQVTIEPGKRYYLMVLGQAGLDHVENNIIYVRSGSNLADVPADKAPAMIEACCAFKAPRQP